MGVLGRWKGVWPCLFLPGREELLSGSNCRLETTTVALPFYRRRVTAVAQHSAPRYNGPMRRPPLGLPMFELFFLFLLIVAALIAILARVPGHL